MSVPALNIKAGTIQVKTVDVRNYVRLIVFKRSGMKSITATKAREKLYKLIDETNSSHEAIHISGKRSNAVLISEKDWRVIEETPYPAC